jgi:hypothetical protein
MTPKRLPRIDPLARAPEAEIIDALAHKPRKQTRKRSWDEQNAGTHLSVWGISAELQAAIARVADDQNVSRGMATSGLLAAGLAAYERGETVF